MKQYVTKGVSEEGTDCWLGQEVTAKRDVKVGVDRRPQDSPQSFIN